MINYKHVQIIVTDGFNLKMITLLPFSEIELYQEILFNICGYKYLNIYLI